MGGYFAQLDDLLSEPLASVLHREQHALGHLLDANGSRLVLFGAGSTGGWAVPKLRSIGVEPLAFADNNHSLWGTLFAGVPVLSPAEAVARFGKNALFLVTIWNEHHAYRETRDQLTGLGVRSVSAVAPLLWRLGGDRLPFFSQDFAHPVYEQAEAVRRASELWSDDQSRCEYMDHIRWRALGDPSAFKRRKGVSSYFPPSLFTLADDEVFVDCGAYDGDTIREMLHRCHSQFGAIHAFEANPDCFNSLRRYVAQLGLDLQPKIHLHEAAVGAERGTIRFHLHQGPGSRISESGDVAVPCGQLDELISSACPTFIKMDIEGAEFDALRGASRLIQEHQPVLAICVYHVQSDIWRIPLLLHNLHPDYRLYLRTYDGDGWQTVCYAVPPKRAIQRETR